MRLSDDLETNLAELSTRLGIGVTFDVLLRRIRVGGREAALLFVDGLVKSKETGDVMRTLQGVRRADLAPKTLEKLLKVAIPYFEVDTVAAVEEVVSQVLAGPIALLVDGLAEAIILDLREYPTRSIEEPDLERVTRGSRDGLVETVVFNTALIRRRLRDPKLRFEMFQVGRRSQTDVVVAYVADTVRPELLESVRRAVGGVDVSALTMGASSLKEFLVGGGLNPFPKARFTERPDVVAAHLVEGHVAILTDTTPTAMVLPANAWHFVQHAEEYFQNPVVGTYLRWVRMVAVVISLVLGPVWLTLATLGPGELPRMLAFIGPRESPTVPLWAQFLVLEFGIDLIRIALIHTPDALATSLGIVGAILLGDLAVTVGLFVPETLLYAAITAMGYFATPSVEFAFAIRLFRYVLFLFVTLLGPWGLAGGLALFGLVLSRTRSFGLPYLWPLWPLNLGALARLLFRYPIPAVGVRIAGQAAPAPPRPSEAP